MEKKKWIRVLLISLALFVCCMIVVQATVTGNGAVSQRQVSFVTDEGVKLNGTLFVPNGATAMSWNWRGAAMWSSLMTTTAPWAPA